MTDTVLVTGGAGYIGSHTCKALAVIGYLPISLDNLIYGHTWAVQWGPLVTGDISDALVLDQVFSQYRPKAVIHFAAFAYVGESVDHPAKYYRNNVVGSLAILDAMRRHGCRNIIFSSSCATYGIPIEVPIPENHPQHPINPYGRTKLMMEQMVDAADASETVLRLFVTVLAYIWVVASIWMTVAPHHFRDLIDWAMANDERCRTVCSLGICLGAVLMALGVLAY